MTMALWTVQDWEFECRFRQQTLTDSAIIGQTWTQVAVNDYNWGIFYNADGYLVFQQWQKDLSSYTVYIDLKVEATLSADTWHHIRVARSGATVYIFLDGVLLGSDDFAIEPDYPAGSEITEGTLTIGDIYYIVSTSSNHFYPGCADGAVFVASEATDIVDPDLHLVNDTANCVRSVSDGLYGQWVGLAHYYNSDGPSDGVRYGNCELDEMRLYFYGQLYDLSGYTPTTNPIADEGEQTHITKGSVDSFSVTVQCPYGLYYAKSSGGLDNVAVDLWVSYRKVGTTAWSRKLIWIWTTSRNPVTRQWTFTPAAGRGQYEIRVTRVQWEWELTQPAERFQTTCFLTSIDEILHEKLVYPHLQLVAISIKAQDKLSGRPPTIRVISNRNQITVPNYNGSGNRFVDPTNNAHACFDMFTNRLYSMGLSATRILQTEWQAWADWCDGVVAGNRRCQINMVFDGNYDMDKALQLVESCGRAKVIPRGTGISVIVEKPVSSTAQFNHANTVPGTNKVTWLRQAERSDGVEITYIDKDLNYTNKTVFAPGSEYHSLTRTPRITRLTLPGIKTNEQALREAIFKQQLSESITRAVTLQSGLEALPVTAGDVFDYNSVGNIMAFSGRLVRGAAREENYTGTTVYLDREITLDSATYSGNCILIVRDPSDVVGQHTVTGPFDVATRSLTVNTSATWDWLAPYIVCRTNDVRQYKVHSISRNSQHDVLIDALQYVPAAYYHSNYDGGKVAI
jgi:hypothetical protein